MVQKLIFGSHGNTIEQDDDDFVPSYLSNDYGDYDDVERTPSSRNTMNMTPSKKSDPKLPSENRTPTKAVLNWENLEGAPREIKALPYRTAHRPAKRELIRWNDDMFNQALLAFWWVIEAQGGQVPWDRIASLMNPSATGDGLKQSMTKLWARRTEAGLHVPPQRPGKDKSVATAQSELNQFLALAKQRDSVTSADPFMQRQDLAMPTSTFNLDEVEASSTIDGEVVDDNEQSHAQARVNNNNNSGHDQNQPRRSAEPTLIVRLNINKSKLAKLARVDRDEQRIGHVQSNKIQVWSAAGTHLQPLSALLVNPSPSNKSNSGNHDLFFPLNSDDTLPSPSSLRRQPVPTQEQFGAPMVGLKRPMSQISSFSDGPAARRPRNAPSPSISLVNNSHMQTWPRNPSPLSQYGSSANTYQQMQTFNHPAYQMAAQMHAQQMSNQPPHQMSNQTPHQMSDRTADVDMKDTPFNTVINATTAGTTTRTMDFGFPLPPSNQQYTFGNNLFTGPGSYVNGLGFHQGFGNNARLDERELRSLPTDHTSDHIDPTVTFSGEMLSGGFTNHSDPMHYVGRPDNELNLDDDPYEALRKHREHVRRTYDE
ncbi:uncharacterized protein K452DRAFT_317697 [Aplosporella prunicola CBS 121167]|uniref:Myb-like domain-containing protein n=1 Tax=Aplosporella prunicola CBS 121167 TaxID=1176127 RepID=A0A6A6BFE2_9PEZI|nr:uncharacterized protein K452DRAFT_317697 [Aplosporella prunicola CBS 121167]KAF2142776.1 hypothetical protein K452DRAFT_317697 [Aplosporella prunicola CBS 121167]